MNVPLTTDQWCDLVNRVHDLVEQYGIDEVKACAQYVEAQCVLKKHSQKAT